MNAWQKNDRTGKKTIGLFHISMKNLVYRLQAVIPSILLLLLLSISGIPVFHSSVLAAMNRAEGCLVRGLPRPEYKC